MAIVKITEENFEEKVLYFKDRILLDFYADWCGPCQMIAPILEEIANEYPTLNIGKVNVDEAGSLAMAYNISSYATLVAIENGKEINKQVGLCTKEKIMEMLLD